MKWPGPKSSGFRCPYSLDFEKNTYVLTEAILKGDCRGLVDVYNIEQESIRTTRSSKRGDLPTTIPKPGFRHQSSRLWNSFSDKKITKEKIKICDN
jgi:hypothetical protein